MSDASAAIVKFFVERAKERAEANAEDTDGFRIDDVGAEDIEAAITANEAEVVQTIDRRFVAGATFYEAGEVDDGSVHAYREQRRRLSKRVVECVAVESVIAESSRSRESGTLVRQNSSKTLAQEADQAVSEVVQSLGGAVRA